MRGTGKVGACRTIARFCLLQTGYNFNLKCLQRYHGIFQVSLVSCINQTIYQNQVSFNPHTVWDAQHKHLDLQHVLAQSCVMSTQFCPCVLYNHFFYKTNEIWPGNICLKQIAATSNVGKLNSRPVTHKSVQLTLPGIHGRCLFIVADSCVSFCLTD